MDKVIVVDRVIVTVEFINKKDRKKITYTFLGNTKVTFENTRRVLEAEYSDVARLPNPVLDLILTIESKGGSVTVAKD